jgi:hypothetical protein
MRPSYSSKHPARQSGGEWRIAWHATTLDDDLDACLQIQPKRMGSGIIGEKVS